MFAPTRTKWLGSIILASVLLALAFMGGKWGTNYSASAGVNATPHIDYIQPAEITAGSTSTVMIIAGSFIDGNLQNTTVRLSGGGIDKKIDPMVVTTHGISVLITADLLVVPTAYSVTVIWSDYNTIPTIPITPHDHESNAVPFTVYQGRYIYLPIVIRNAGR
jgi:hypothetical protein